MWYFIAVNQSRWTADYFRVDVMLCQKIQNGILPKLLPSVYPQYPDVLPLLSISQQIRIELINVAKCQNSGVTSTVVPDPFNKACCRRTTLTCSTRQNNIFQYLNLNQTELSLDWTTSLDILVAENITLQKWCAFFRFWEDLCKSQGDLPCDKIKPTNQMELLNKPFLECTLQCRNCFLSCIRFIFDLSINIIVGRKALGFRRVNIEICIHQQNLIPFSHSEVVSWILQAPRRRDWGTSSSSLWFIKNGAD